MAVITEIKPENINKYFEKLFKLVLQSKLNKAKNTPPNNSAMECVKTNP
jgi:hypothetical protein